MSFYLHEIYATLANHLYNLQSIETTGYVTVTSPVPLLFLLNPFCNYVHTHS